MLDTISLSLQGADIPTEVRNKAQYSFEIFGIMLYPQYSRRGHLKSYAGEYRGLYVSQSIRGLYITNSWHNYYSNENYGRYTYSNITDTFHELNEKFKGNLNAATIHRIDIGININGNYSNINDWGRMKAKSPTPMHSQGSVYGTAYRHQEYSFKAYDKSVQYQRQYGVQAPKNILRIEKTIAKSKLLKRISANAIITARDLTNKDNLIILRDDFLKTYNQIKMEGNINYCNLSLREMRIVTTMQDVKAREVLKKAHFNTYRKDMKIYNDILKREKSKDNNLYKMKQEFEAVLSA